MQRVYADGGYAGRLVGWAKDKTYIVLEIMRRNAMVKGFEVLPRRWVVERTFAWIMKNRRLVRDYEQLTAVAEVGPKVAASLHEFFAEPRNQALIADLKSVGLTMLAEKRVTTTHLEGLTFVLTGTLPTLTREAAKERIESAGGRASGTVSKKTSYVVAGEEAGSQLERAQALGVKILDEAGLLSLLSDVPQNRERPLL